MENRLIFFVFSCRLKVFSLTVLLCMVSFAFSQQPISAGQSINNLTPLNPAFSVIKQTGSVNFSAKKQWTGIQGAPGSVLFNVDTYLEGIDASVGVVGMNSKIGIENLNDASVFIAKAVRLDGAHYLSASLNAGGSYFNASYSRLDAFDPKFDTDIRQFSPTIGFGLMFYDPEKFYLGVSIPKLIFGKRDLSAEVNNSYNTWYFSGAYFIQVNTDISIRPAGLLSYTPSQASLLDLSAMVYLKKSIGLGLGYRSDNQISGILNYIFNRRLSIGYSYQTSLGINNDGNVNITAHEISLGYRFGASLSNML